MVITFILLMCELGFAIDVIETTSSADVYNVCMKADTPAVAIDPATGKTFDCTGFATNTFRLGSYLVWQFLWNEGQLHYEATLIETGEVDADGAAIMGTGTSQQRKSYELAAGFQDRVGAADSVRLSKALRPPTLQQHRTGATRTLFLSKSTATQSSTSSATATPSTRILSIACAPTTPPSSRRPVHPSVLTTHLMLLLSGLQLTQQTLGLDASMAK